MKSPKVKGIGEVVTEYGARVMKIFKKGLLGRSLFDFYGDVKAQTFRTKESASVPSTPSDGAGGIIYTKGADGKLYYKSNEVAEVELSSSGATLTQEQVEDYAGALAATGGTKTGITVTYQDGTGDMDFVVDHDAASNFVAAEHVDWAGASAGTIHSTNIPTLNQDTTGSSASCTGNAATATSAGRIIGPTDSDVTISSDGNITFMLDDDDDETGQSFSFKNNDTEIANLSERGDLQIDGTITAKQRGVFNQSFHDDLSTTKHYLPWSGTLEQSANPYQEEVAMVAPCGGRIVSCTVRTNSITGSGDMSIGIHTREAGALVGSGWVEEETEELAITSTDDNHAFHFVFGNAKHFEPGELIVISIDNSVDLSGYTYWYISTVVEWDWNDLLGTISGEHD